MKAFYSTAYGGPEVSFYGDYPDPVVGEGKVLVSVKAVSINPADYKIKRGDLKTLAGDTFPRILGSDFSGIVKGTGSGVTKFRQGDRVYGMTPVFLGKPGALAELLTVAEKNIRVIPEEMSFEEAAALPAASLTALNGLRNCGNISRKQLLINGATGGVGHYAIQIASALGAMVTATCSSENAELARKLGAKEIAGQSSTDLVKSGKKFDAILDAYGKMEYSDIYRLLKRNGIYASTLRKPSGSLKTFLIRFFYGKKLTDSNMRATPGDYQEIENLFRQKKLFPVIEHKFALEKAADAFKLAESGKHRGKIIVNI